MTRQLSSASRHFQSSGFSFNDEISLPFSAKGHGFCRNRHAVCVQASKDYQISKPCRELNAGSGSFASRSRNVSAIAGFAMAASVTIGMSSIAFYDITMAVEQDVNSTTVELSTTSNGIGAQGENSSPSYITTNYSADPSISSQPPSNLSFSIAIPIPHEREWIIIRNGYVAPVPLLQKHVSSGLQCPQWTPSKLEMVLPDFNGRPKAFPRKGYHWFASFVLTGTRDGDFLRLADSRDEIEHIASVHDNTLNSVREELGQQKGMSSAFKKPRVEKLTCFSM